MESENNIQNGVPETPGTEMMAEKVVVTETKPVTSEAPRDDIVFNDKPKKNTGMILGMILLLILAIGGIGFGIWAWMDGNKQKEQLNSQIDTLKTQNNELSDKLATIDNTTAGNGVDISTDMNTDINTADYIYIGEWGLKIKKPAELFYVEYELTSSGDLQTLCLTGARAEDKNLTGDAGPFNLDTMKMGCVSRGPSSMYPVDGTYPSLGKLFTIDNFTFLVYGPQTNMTDFESESINVNLIFNMLNNPDNYSKI